MDINRLRNLAESIWADYESQANGTKRWLQDYRKEVQAYKEYRGREIFELLQNADDACSSCVEISIDRSARVLTVVNSGQGTVPFSETGIQSIMLSDLSPKKGEKMIGAKGLGFRSVLNWTDRIEIRSGNVSLRFGNDIVQEHWARLKGKVDDADQYEREAAKDGRCVPLAILALPKISELDDAESIGGTSIILAYDEGYEQGILADLENFQPESLLFLHHIKQVVIKMDGSQKSSYGKSQIKDCGDGIAKCELDGKRWVQSSKSGTLQGCGDEYEVSCAFCLDNPQESYPVFSYFPTQVYFPFPCIFHATLELDSSRNALLPGNENNKRMMAELAMCASAMAGYLKGLRHGWYPYMLMKPAPRPATGNEYVRLLVEEIGKLSEGAAYIPTLDGGYADENGYYYYSNDFYDFVAGSTAAVVFPKLRLNGAPAYAKLERHDPECRCHIEAYARQVSHDIDAMARYLAGLLACSNAIGQQCHVLLDAEGDIISGTAYVNTGMVVEGIPDFRRIKYVNDGLVAKLKELLNMHGKESDRDLVTKLKSITDVSATDVSAVTRNLLPKVSDKELCIEQKQELIKCLFRLFLKRGKLVDLSADGKAVAYLPSQLGEWLPAGGLVFADKRFPDGFDRLGVSYSYADGDCVQYPEFLEDIDGGTPMAVQQFYCELGVNLYFKRETVNYGGDAGYIGSLGLSDSVARNCTPDRVRDANSAQVGDRGFFAKLPLGDLLAVIEKSGYAEEVCGGQNIHWFKNSWQKPERVPLSYAAYTLRNVESVRPLRYYVIDENTWLAGFEPEGKPLFSQSYGEKRLLQALGAKRSMDEFTAEELYDAVNNVEGLYDGSTSYAGVQAIYHTLKQALSRKSPSGLPDGRMLRMLCRIGDAGYEFRNSREIYYSDNNELPDDVVKNLPMLVMGRREGELEVKNIFGCKRLKDISVNIEKKEPNENLTRELNLHIEKRKPHILAFSSREKVNESTMGHLKNFKVEVVSGVEYGYAIDGISLLADKAVPMGDGELLCASSEYYVCSYAASLVDAMSNPRFNNAVVEALCIKLNLSSSEIANRFYRIFTSSERELEYYREQEIDARLWHECEDCFGMTGADVDFWAKVFEVNGQNCDEAELRDKRLSYLIDKLHIETERLASPEDFSTYHFQCLKQRQSHYLKGYMHFVYMQIEGYKELHKEYLQRIAPFKNERWIRDILEQDDNRFRIGLDYDRLVREAMKKEFNYEPVADFEEHPKFTCYLRGINEYYLDEEGKSLLYFAGHEDYFAGLRDEDDEDNGSSQPVAGQEDAHISIKEVDMARKPVLNKSGRLPDGGSGGRQKISERRKRQLGDEAEDKVLRALTDSEEYEIGEVYSSHLSSDGRGDNNKGYDLEYRRKGETYWRCLEIKHFDGASIVLTGNEYEVSQQPGNKGRYDLALVLGNEIQIKRDAFSDPDKFTKVANGYTVYFSIVE